jgi:hypothetical protein
MHPHSEKLTASSDLDGRSWKSQLTILPSAERDCIGISPTPDIAIAAMLLGRIRNSTDGACGIVRPPIVSLAWCSWRRVTAFAGKSRAGQLAIA